MSGRECHEAFLNLLNTVFESCDVDRNGYVDIDVLLNCLITQDPNGSGDKRIEEECKKLLQSSGETRFVTKDHFINSFLSCFGRTNKEKEENKDMCLLDFDHNSMKNNSTISETVLEPSCNQSDYQQLSDDDSPDSKSESDSFKDNKRLTPLKMDLIMVLKKNELLDSNNMSLLSQITCLEETLVKKEQELSVQLNKLKDYSGLLKIEKEKKREVEEMLSMLMEENKSIRIQLIHCEKEKKELTQCNLMLEDQMELLSKAKLKEDRKIEEIKLKFTNMSSLYNQSQQDLEITKLALIAENKSLLLIQEENTTLKVHLESDSAQIEALKTQLNAAQKDLKLHLKNKVHNSLESKSYNNNSNSDHLWEETIQDDDYYTYLRANSLSTEIALSCTKNKLFKSDIGVGTEDIDWPKIKMANEQFLDYEKNCSRFCKTCNLTCKRSIKKWIILGILIFFFSISLGLGLYAASARLSNSFKLHQHTSTVFSSLLYELKQNIVYQNIKAPIH